MTKLGHGPGERPLTRTEREVLLILRHAHWTLDCLGVPRAGLAAEKP